MNLRSERVPARTGLRLHVVARLLGFAGATLCTSSSAVAAPTPHDCAAASEDAASLQKQEKLGAAKDRYLVCADPACPAEIREECAHRLTEVTDATPSVVFEVKDASGNDVSAVRVTMDGALLVDHLGASAITIDPGEHTFRFDGADPSQSIEKTFVVRDGEKNRHLAVTLGGAGAPPVTTPASTGAAPATPTAPAAPATSDQAPKSNWSQQKTIAFIVGGGGIIAIGVGAIFGAMTFSQWNNAKSECTATTCGAGSQAQQNANGASTSATVSDVGFIAGGVLVAGAAVLWFTAPSGAKVQVAPTASPQGAGLTLRGTF
jgi:hypothetical protein